MGLHIEFYQPWLSPALDRMLEYRRSAVQSWVGVGSRDLQLAFARTLMHLKLVDRTVVIAMKVLHEQWKSYGKLYEDWAEADVRYLSQVTARQHSEYAGLDMERTCFIIDIGISGRHTAAAINYELRNARWVSSRQTQSVKLTERQPLLVTPVEIVVGKLVKGGVGVAQD